MMKTGITGATGQLGQLVVAKLKQKIDPSQIVGLVRNPAKGEGLGIELRPFDYTQTDTLAKNLEGIDQLLLISSSEVGQRKAQHENIINAAKTAGVKRIVYTSLLHADTSTISLAPEHYETEQLLEASGIAYTILRNGWYTENYNNAIGGAVQAGALIGCAGEGKISAATREDYAEAAVAVLTSDGHEGKIYELAGDEPFTLIDLAAEVSRQTGKEIPYQHLSVADYAEALKSLGLPDGIAQAIASWDGEAAKDQLFDNSKTLSKLIGRPTTPLREVVKSALR